MQGKTITAVSYGTLGGFGTGIVVSTVFLAATQQPPITITQIFTSFLTLVLTAVGFGLGLGQGMSDEGTSAIQGAKTP